MRMPADEPIMQSQRVMATISMIVATPRPSAPIIQPSAPRSSVSLDAFETLPILRLRRMICSGFLVPSGGQHEKRVTHRRRDEELVADEFVSLAASLGAHGNGPRGIGAHVRAALLLGHRHADRQALFLIGGDVTRIVDARLGLR